MRNYKKASKKIEDVLYEDYDTVNSVEHPLEKLIVENVHGIVLDVGCGPGIILKKLQELGFVSEGIDASKVAIQEAKRRGVKRVFLKTINDFKTRKKYDTIISLATLYYLNNFERDFRKITSLLKEDGTMIVNFYNPLRRRDRFSRVTYKQFMQGIKREDLSVERIIPVGRFKNRFLSCLNIFVLKKMQKDYSKWWHVKK